MPLIMQKKIAWGNKIDLDLPLKVFSEVSFLFFF